MILHTLQIEHACLLLVYTLLTSVNARVQSGLRGVRLFAAYNGLALAGAVLVLLRGSIPDVLSIVGGNCCVLAAYLALFASMAQLFHFRQRHRQVAFLLFGLGVLSMVACGVLQVGTPRRLILYSLFLATQQLQLALLLLRPSRRHGLGWMPGSLLSALAVANLIRVAIVWQQGAPADYRQSGASLGYIVLSNACLQCGLMISYVWMTAAQLRHDLQLQASTDSLTGLLNRRALESKAADCLAQIAKRSLSVLLLDLDHYKPINDRFGHAAGDQALISVADLLRRELGTAYPLARIGGDEFMVLLPGLSRSNALRVAETLRASLEVLPLGLQQQDLRICGSFGLAEAASGETWDHLCWRCDRAMYDAKLAGGNAVRESVPDQEPKITPELCGVV